MVLRQLSAKCCLYFVVALITPVGFSVGISDEHATGTMCFKDGRSVEVADRKNIKINGVEMPLGIWLCGWPASDLFSRMFKILAEEKLGYHVVLNGLGPGSASAIYALAGCVDGTDCSPHITIPESHLAFDVWSGGAASASLDYGKWHPKQSPINIGSVGYVGVEGFFIDRHILNLALASTGIGLDLFRSYNADFFDVRPFFSNHRAINTTDLWTCLKVNENNAIAPALMGTNYRKHFPEDVDGYELYTDSNGEERTRLHCPSDGYWWYSRACRHNVSTCIPVLSSAQGWGAHLIMQRATYYNMPIALGFANSWNTYISVAKLYRLLHYWYIPEVSFDIDKMVLVYFPEYNKTQWDDALYLTQQSRSLAEKWAHPELQLAAGRVFKTASRIELPLHNALMPLLIEFSKSNKTPYHIACDFLQSGVWKDWVPDPTDCDVGTGLVDSLDSNAHFVSSRSAAMSCKACAPGRYSIAYSDTSGSSFECQNCSEGRFSDAYRSEACSICPPGTTQPRIGQSRCLECGPGKYAGAMENASTCIPCQSGRYSSSPGSLSCDSCSAGTFAEQNSMSSCIVCPIGTFGQSAGESSCIPCDLHVLGSSSARASQSSADCFCPKNKYKAGSACKDCGIFKMTEDAGATSQDDCYFGYQLYLVIFIPVLCLILVALVCVGVRYFQRAMRQVQEVQHFEKIIECIQHSRDLAFPLVVMEAENFRSLGRLVSYEEALDRHLLRVLPTVQQIEQFKLQNKIVFFSHQWLAWGEPDPDAMHYNAIVQAMDAVLRVMEWKKRHCYVWVDYHSVPQQSKQLLQMAIRTLPFFASFASLFIMIAPDAVHADTALPCNYETYRRRMWCRAEIFSYYCRRGVSDMYRLVETSTHSSLNLGKVILAKVEEEEINEVILVFEGQCSCCARNHAGMTLCDKELLRDVFVGIYADVLWTAQALPAREGMLKVHSVEKVVARINSQRERIFPRSFELTYESESTRSKFKAKKTRFISESLSGSVGLFSDNTSAASVKCIRKPLFGDLVDYLEQLIQEKAEIVEHLFDKTTILRRSMCGMRKSSRNTVNSNSPEKMLADMSRKQSEEMSQNPSDKVSFHEKASVADSSTRRNDDEFSGIMCVSIGSVTSLNDVKLEDSTSLPLKTLSGEETEKTGQGITGTNLHSVPEQDIVRIGDTKFKLRPLISL